MGRHTPEQDSLFDRWFQIAIALFNLVEFEPENKETLLGKRSAYMWGAERAWYATREQALEESRDEVVRCRTYPGQPEHLLVKADTLEKVIIPNLERIPWNEP